MKVAGSSRATVAVAVGPPLAVRRKVLAGMPVPVSGMRAGELVSELVTTRVPVREPRAVGVKVTVIRQVAAGARLPKVQGVVMA